MLVLLIAIGIGGRPLNDLLPGFAAEVFRAAAGGLSLLASATGAGAIVGGLWLGHRADASGLTRVAIAASVAGAVAAATVAATDRLWLGIAPIMAFGFCVSSAGIAIQTLVQLGADRAMRGRVMGLYGLIFRRRSADWLRAPHRRISGCAGRSCSAASWCTRRAPGPIVIARASKPRCPARRRAAAMRHRLDERDLFPAFARRRQLR